MFDGFFIDHVMCSYSALSIPINWDKQRGSLTFKRLVLTSLFNPVNFRFLGPLIVLSILNQDGFTLLYRFGL